MKQSKFCQSCLMPLKDKYGTNSDGSFSEIYCINCFRKGDFVENLSVEEMRDLVKRKMVEMGYPKFLSNIFSKKIYKLERWKNVSNK